MNRRKFFKWLTCGTTIIASSELYADEQIKITRPELPTQTTKVKPTISNKKGFGLLQFRPKNSLFFTNLGFIKDLKASFECNVQFFDNKSIAGRHFNDISIVLIPLFNIKHIDSLIVNDGLFVADIDNKKNMCFDGIVTAYSLTYNEQKQILMEIIVNTISPPVILYS